MTWTSELPTEPGWYYWRAGKDAPPDLVLLAGNGLCRLRGVGYSVRHTTGQWAGPLIPPPDQEAR